MTQLLCHVLSDRVDRVRELVNVGAGHAAGALSELIGQPCWMEVPEVVNLCADERNPQPDDVPETAVFFEIQGALRGTVVVRFPQSTADHLVDLLLKEDRRRSLRDSSLQEVANILASHAVAAMGGLLGEALCPSVPVLVPHDAEAALMAVCSLRRSTGSSMRVETTLRDAAGAYRTGLVYIPEEI